MTSPPETGAHHHGEAEAGDEIPQNCQVIEVRVAELNQLFNAIDPRGEGYTTGPRGASS
jgi:hypothetical protein